MTDAYPTYAELQARTDAPAGSSWAVFTEHPERGMANFADPSSALRGARTMRTGRAVNLDHPADAFQPSPSRARRPPVQELLRPHEDSVDDVWHGYYPQASTHIDGLRHRRAHGLGFYNRVADDAVAPGRSELGVQVWAEHPIVTRGLVVDVLSSRRDAGRPIDHAAGETLELGDLLGALERQGSTVEPGDALLIRTGWAAWYLALSQEEREHARAARRTTGFRQSTEFLAWTWDARVSLLATDTFAVEVLPPVDGSPFLGSSGADRGMMHQQLIALLGCPLGELWKLDELAAACDERGSHEVFLTVKPLNLPGAVGSPANAVAVL